MRCQESRLFLRRGLPLNAGSGVVAAEPFDMELSKAYCGCGCLFLWWIIANCSCCSCDAAKTEKSINAMRACFHAWLSLLCCRLKRKFRVQVVYVVAVSMSPIIRHLLTLLYQQTEVILSSCLTSSSCFLIHTHIQRRRKASKHRAWKKMLPHSLNVMGHLLFHQRSVKLAVLCVKKKRSII